MVRPASSSGNQFLSMGEDPLARKSWQGDSFADVQPFGRTTTYVHSLRSFRKLSAHEVHAGQLIFIA